MIVRIGSIFLMLLFSLSVQSMQRFLPFTKFSQKALVSPCKRFFNRQTTTALKKIVDDPEVCRQFLKGLSEKSFAKCVTSAHKIDADELALKKYYQEEEKDWSLGNLSLTIAQNFLIYMLLSKISPPCVGVALFSNVMEFYYGVLVKKADSITSKKLKDLIFEVEKQRKDTPSLQDTKSA